MTTTAPCSRSDALTIADAISTHPLFAKLSPLQKARLLAASKIQHFATDELILEAHQTASHYLWILQGSAVYLAPENPVVQPSDGIGQEVFSEGPPEQRKYLASVRALTAVCAIRIERSALQDITTSQPELRSRALLTLAARLGNLTTPVKPAKPPDSPAPTKPAFPYKALLGWSATIVLPLIVWKACLQHALPPHSAAFLGLFTMMVLMWLFSLVDEFIPPLIVVVAILFVDLVPPRVALHGFYSRAFMLLLGVYAISALMVSSGLAYRFMLWLLIRLPDRPFWHRTALSLFGALLSIVMPSASARMSLMLPLYQEMNSSLKLRPKSPESSALAISTFTGATLFAPIFLTAKSSNLAAFSMMPSQVREQFQGSSWFFSALVVALGLSAMHFWFMRRRWLSAQPKVLPKDRIVHQLKVMGKLQTSEWVAAFAFIVFLLGSVTPQWHQSQAAWLSGLVLVSLLALGLFDKKAFQGKIEWPMIFFLLSLDGITDAITYLGLDTLLFGRISHSLQWMDESLPLFIILAFVVTVGLRLALPLTAGMILAVTILLPTGIELGIHPWIIVFLTSLFSDIWFMPYQNSTYQQAVNAGMGQNFERQTFMRYNLLLNLARVVLAFASIPYWQWLGLQ